MKIGLSFVTLASAAVLALSAAMAQARVGVGEDQATAARAQAGKAIAQWYQSQAHFFNKMKQDQTRHQTLHRSLRPDDRAGVRGVAP
jgi:flagellar basal body-associated protein FliL